MKINLSPIEHTELAKEMVSDLSMDELIVFIKALIVETESQYGDCKELIGKIRASIH